MKIGDKVILSDSGRENESYNAFKDKTLIITHVATCIEEHQGYDEGLNG